LIWILIATIAITNTRKVNRIIMKFPSRRFADGASARALYADDEWSCQFLRRAASKSIAAAAARMRMRARCMNSPFVANHCAANFLPSLSKMMKSRNNPDSLSSLMLSAQ
jgi:hypothetical protein